MKNAIAILFVLVLLLVPVGVFAQDATEEAPAVVEAGENNEVTIESPSAPVVVETQDNLNWLLVWVGAVSTLLLGGLGLGIFARLNSNPQLKDSTEALLANSVPASALESANKLSEALLAQSDNAMGIIKNLLEFARDVTDGKPNSAPKG